MSLSLQQQLSKIGTADLKNVTETSRKYKASFLFTEKEAADQDLETIYSLAHNGFLELVNLNSSFTPYETTLFSDKSKSVNRILLTQKENDQLNTSISSFLQQLSPYFLLNPAGKVLEWLIRRFDIQKNNIEAVLVCILPYHETKSFVKMVSLLEIPDNSPWLFLKVIRTSRVPLERDLLVGKLSKSRFMVDFVCKMATSSTVHFSALYTFYAATIIDYIKSSRRVSEDMATSLTKYLVDGLRAKRVPELQLATYMILSQLSSKTTFNEEAAAALTTTMIKRCNHDLFRHCLLTIIHLAQTQPNFTLDNDTCLALMNHSSFSTCFSDISGMFATDKFMTFMIPHFITNQKTELLEHTLTQGYLSRENVRLVCEKVMEGYIKLRSDKKKSDAYIQQIKPLLSIISQRYVEELDYVLETKLEQAKEDKYLAESLYQLSASAFQGTRHQLVEEANSTLYLCLNNPSAAIRLLGIKKLVDVLKTGDQSLLQSSDVITSAFTNCLEEYGDLLGYALNEVPDILLQYVPADTILSRLHTVLQGHGAYAHKQAVSVLNFLLVAYIHKHPSEKSNVARIFASFIFAASGDNLSQLSTMVKKVKFGKDILGGMVDCFLKVVNKADTSFEFVKQQASKVDDLNFWLVMMKSTSRMERMLALWIVGYSVSITKGQQQIVMASKLFNTIITSYDDIQALYSTKLDKKLVDAEHPWNLSLFKQMQDVDNLTDKLETNLVQLLFLNMTDTLDNSVIDSKNWFNKSQDEGRDVLTGLFKVFVGGHNLGCFESMLTKLISIHLKDNLLSFLVSQWTNKNNSSIVRARSLQIAASYMQSYATNHTVSDFQHLVPLLLPSLKDEEQLVRAASLSCLKNVDLAYQSIGLPTSPAFYNGSSSKKKATSQTKKAVALKSDTVYGPSISILVARADDIAHFVDHIIHFRREIAQDDSYINRIVLEYMQTSLDSKNKTARESVNRILDLLLHHVIKAPVIQIQIDIMAFLDGVNTGRKLEKVIHLLEKALDSERTQANTALITLLIRCFIPTGKHLNGKDLEVFMRLLSNQDNLLGEDDEGWQISTRRSTLRQITEEFYAGAGTTAQQQILTLLIDIATNEQQHDVRLAKNVLMTISIPGSMLEKYLMSAAKSLLAPEPEANSSKRSRSEKSPSAEKPVDLYELVTVLELVESKSTMDDILLIKPLFEVLTALVNADLRNSPVSLEYINQLIMSALTRIIQTAEDEQTTVDESTLRVDVVVQCIRITGNPQTHNQALLLMATIASMYPESVLHNIMPVFTFMGANVLRQDDNYSFQVIQQTLEKVIPPLVASRRLASDNNAMALAIQVKPIIKVFVDALFHIPKHRRLRLFTVLIQTLGQDEFLATIISLLLEKFTEKLAKGSRTEADSLLEFSLMVSEQFSPQTQMKSILALLNGLLQLPNEKLDDDTMMEIDSLFNINEHTAKQLRQYKLVTVKLIDQILASQVFLNKVMMVSQSLDTVEDQMQPFFLEAVEVVLKVVTYFTDFRDQYSVSENAHPTVTKFWRAILKVVYDVLNKLNALLPLHAFINVVSHLVKHPQVPIRRKAMTIFNEKMVSYRHAPEDEELALADMVKTFTTTIQNEANTANEEDAAINKQAALLCIGSLANLLGHIHPANFVDAIPIIGGPDCLQNTNTQLQVSSLVCLSMICQQVGPRAVPHLPKFMPVLLNMLMSTVNDPTPNTTLQLGVISTVETIVTVLPHFLSPYLSKLLAGLLHTSIYDYDSEDTQRSLSHSKAKNVLTEMATNVPPRVLLAPVFGFYEKAVENGTKSTLALYSLVAQAIQSMPRDVITTHYKQIFKFFLLAFDMRRLHPDMDSTDIDELESSIIDSFLGLVMKLNETLFKPLFLKIVDWATVEQPDENRSLFFYKLLDSLLEKLKSIFTPYIGYVVEDMMTRLTAYGNGTLLPDTLWNYLFTTLRKSFLYDNDNLWNADRFDKMVDPVLEQLLVTESGDCENYLSRMITYVVPCIAQMAVTVSNDTLWKPLNHKVLMKTREDDPEIRLAALRVIEEFYNRLGDEWLLFLAESISFLAELMEDDDIRVEKLVQQVNAQIETHLGESLDKFFN
ncbi:uncharacterized protein BX664DRAFT_290957 [Halteromyces radiatus]|uniref:uncharacterized protein n=1 Tax=Halteromyces radiatus TaxID=101107 RepID=UPI00221F9668|nr:uncharacterized protein BX664DRAFT_290957 [Halteromyces radiatus]KAI8096220.1 hypothetical protein BX664DRAFT_290957 [Halteromyces radiatus]